METKPGIFFTNLEIAFVIFVTKFITDNTSFGAIFLNLSERFLNLSPKKSLRDFQTSPVVPLIPLNAFFRFLNAVFKPLVALINALDFLNLLNDPTNFIIPCTTFGRIPLNLSNPLDINPPIAEVIDPITPGKPLTAPVNFPLNQDFMESTTFLIGSLIFSSVFLKFSHDAFTLSITPLSSIDFLVLSYRDLKVISPSLAPSAFSPRPKKLSKPSAAFLTQSPNGSRVVLIFSNNSSNLPDSLSQLLKLNNASPTAAAIVKNASPRGDNKVNT